PLPRKIPHTRDEEMHQRREDRNRVAQKDERKADRINRGLVGPKHAQQEEQSARNRLKDRDATVARRAKRYEGQKREQRGRLKHRSTHEIRIAKADFVVRSIELRNVERREVEHVRERDLRESQRMIGQRE